MTVPCGRALPAAVLALSCALEAAAASGVDAKLIEREAVRRHVEKQVEARGRAVAVRGAVSSLTVLAAPGDQVRVTADLKFWSNDEAAMAAVKEAFDVEVSEGGSRVEVGVELPRVAERGFLSRLFKDRSVHYAIDLSVTVPPSVPVEIDNQYGDVTARGLGAGLRVANTSGRITVERVRGEVTLDGRYGDVEVGDIDGPLRVTTTSGAVRASGLRESATIGTSYGDVEVGPVAGALTVATTSGKVTAADVGGAARITTSYGDVQAARLGSDLTVEVQSGTSHISGVAGALRLSGSYGDVTVERVGGAAEIATTSGSVTASDVEGDLVVRCSYGGARLRRVGGRLQVAASSTTVMAESIAGPAVIETSYGSVSLDGVGGAVTVVNQSGGVTVKGLSGGALAAGHRVETSYADIDFTWPAGEPVSFTLESSYGRVESRIPGTMRESGSRRILEGSRGSARARLTLVSQSGSVTLRSP